MKGAKQFFVFAASRFALAAFLNPEKNGDSCDYPALKLPHLSLFKTQTFGSSRSRDFSLKINELQKPYYLIWKRRTEEVSANLGKMHAAAFFYSLHCGFWFWEVPHVSCQIRNVKLRKTVKNTSLISYAKKPEEDHTVFHSSHFLHFQELIILKNCLGSYLWKKSVLFLCKTIGVNNSVKAQVNNEVELIKKY